VNLDGVEQVFAYVATCGRELDSIPLAASDIFGQFCRDTIKEMALWTAIAHLHEHLTETYGLQRLVTMNPGSGEANVWPIEQQRQLFALLGNVEAAIGVVPDAAEQVGVLHLLSIGDRISELSALPPRALSGTARAVRRRYLGAYVRVEFVKKSERRGGSCFDRLSMSGDSLVFNQVFPARPEPVEGRVPICSRSPSTTVS